MNETRMIQNDSFLSVSSCTLLKDACERFFPNSSAVQPSTSTKIADVRKENIADHHVFYLITYESIFARSQKKINRKWSTEKDKSLGL